MESQTLSGKVALVTGAANGLGAASARALAARGARIVAVDVDADGAAALAQELGGLAFAADVSSLDENRAAMAFAAAEAGGLDLVLLNAGITTGCGVGRDFDPERYRRAIGVNLDGVVYGTAAAGELMRGRGGGSIVATASLAGIDPLFPDPIYSAGKHAIVGFVRSAALGLAFDGIRLNALCPAFAESALIAGMRRSLKRAGHRILPAEQVGTAAADLLEAEVRGECWTVQDGLPAAPFAFAAFPAPGEAAA